MADSALPILLFLGFLFVSITLILGLGIMSREEERAREEAEAAATAGSATAPRASEELPAVGANRVRPFLATEDRMAVQSAHSETVDELVEQLEAFLQDEARAVEAFVAAPSVGGLHGTARRADA